MTKPQKIRPAGEFAKIRESTYGAKQPVTSDQKVYHPTQKKHTKAAPVDTNTKKITKRNGPIFS